MALRHRVLPALLMTLVLAASACGGGVGSDRQEGEVVSFGMGEIPLDAIMSGNVDEGEFTITSLNVDIGDEVVEATVGTEDQDELASQFSSGDLSEGDRVVIEQTEDDAWVFVEIAGGS